MTMDYQIVGFDFVHFIGLVAITFIVGYIFGWVFVALWNVMHKNA